MKVQQRSVKDQEKCKTIEKKEDAVETILKYVVNEVKVLVKDFKQIGSKITDKVTKIKLAETISNLKKVKSAKAIKESHLSAMMMSYELLKELKDASTK